MVRIRALALGVCAALVMSVVPPSPARGCTGATPSFADAVASSRAIARVVVTEVDAYLTGAAETFVVVRTLKGQLPDTYRLDDPRTGICGDSIGYYVGLDGEAIVAFGIPWYDTVVNPAWVAGDSVTEPLTGYGSWPPPEGVTTLDELEALIVASLPDTALPAPRSPLVGYVIILFGAAGFAYLGGRRRSAMVDTGNETALESAH